MAISPRSCVRSTPKGSSSPSCRSTSRPWTTCSSRRPDGTSKEPGTRIPGFPTDSFVAFALAVPFVQGALLATINANVEFARDIQTGFLNRLALTPVRGIVLLFGQLGGLVTIAVVQAVFYLAVGLAFGVRLQSGIGGAAMLLLLETCIALA